MEKGASLLASVHAQSAKHTITAHTTLGRGFIARAVAANWYQCKHIVIAWQPLLYFGNVHTSR